MRRLYFHGSGFSRFRVLSLMFAFLGGCINPAIFFKKDRPGKSGLIVDGGFESTGSWRISAPPNFTSYAQISIDNAYSRSGGKSAYVRIDRHPRVGGAEILHAWTQKIGAVPAGAKVKLGGWVRTNGRPKVKLGLNIEFAEAADGRTFAALYLDQPAEDGLFGYVERVIQLPNVVTAVSVRAGISTIGEVWFDDLFLEVVQ